MRSVCNWSLYQAMLKRRWSLVSMWSAGTSLLCILRHNCICRRIFKKITASSCTLGFPGEVKVTQLSLTLCDPMSCTVHGILQPKILEWAAFPFSRGSSSSIPGLGRSAGEWIVYPPQYSWASLVARLVKNPPAMWETWVWSLGWEDPLEKGKTTHSSIVAWRIPWTV